MGADFGVESFQPPLRTLMGPGPSDVHPRVLSAMARPTLGHLDPELVRMMDELKIWRVGLMGYSSREENVFKCLHAFERVVSGMGLAVPAGDAEGAAGEALASQARAATS